MLLQAVHSDAGEIEVREEGGFRWMHFGGEAIQAMMVLDDPSRPIIPYQTYMLAGLLFNQTPNFLLNLGAGGGSFERFFAAHMPELMVTSVESNPDVIGLLKEHFSIQGNFPIVNQDAAKYLDGCTTSYDMILCDLFDHNDHSSCIFDSGLFADAFRCLSTNGVLAINLLPETEAEMVKILFEVRNSFDRVLMMEVPNYKNILLFCLQQDAPGKDLLELRCEKLQKVFGIDLMDVPGLVIELPKRKK